MRAVVQRVRSASVDVDGEVVGKIDQGLLVFLGVGEGDTGEDAKFLADKIVGLRTFPNEAGKMAHDVRTINGALLVVSQFTLLADFKKGLRPSFSAAMEPIGAEALYLGFCQAAAQRGVPVATGRFRADMQVHSQNDGPVTYVIDSLQPHHATIPGARETVGSGSQTGSRATVATESDLTGKTSR